MPQAGLFKKDSNPLPHPPPFDDCTAVVESPARKKAGGFLLQELGHLLRLGRAIVSSATTIKESDHAATGKCIVRRFTQSQLLETMEVP